LTVPMKDRPYSRKEVVDIIQSVLAGMNRETPMENQLHDQLTSISSYIQNMRSELAQMRSIEISHNHIPTATDELDAVVSETAKATGTIMDACEKIEGIAGTMDGQNADDLRQAVTSVYEACTFQDITGQRINKVVKALKNIEAKVGEILDALSHAPKAPDAAKPDAPKDGKTIMAGPAIGGPTVNQDEIDKLLASFD
jgi:chemotaxis protein CheZ